jgi:streptogramin lyase
MIRILGAMLTTGLAVLVLVISQIVAGASGSDRSDIDGQVTSDGGRPEAGVWVVAETNELPTPYRKIVVTNDEGRFVIPDLPHAGYRVWVRGYGLRDSGKVEARPGASLALRASKVTNPKEAALIYPASYWLSLLKPPAESEFENRGRQEAGQSNSTARSAIPASYSSQAVWVGQFKLSCVLCHQLGSMTTRSRPPDLYDAGLRKGGSMSALADGLGRERLLRVLADWSERIAAGQVPEPPPRPQGVERNVVITEWAWGDTFSYAHDEVATDKRDPTVNANGPVYGIDLGNDHLLVLDPKANKVTQIKVPTRGGFATPWCEQTYKPIGGREGPSSLVFASLGCPAAGGVSAFTGKYVNPANPHNPMMDDAGRVWMTTQIRREWAEDLPSFCKDKPGIVEHDHHRQLAYYDPKEGRFELIDTCYGTHHLQFDAKGVLWTSGDSHVIGWFDPKKYDPADPKTLQTAQGWSELVVDSSDDGKKHEKIVGFHYGVIPNPSDGSVWSAIPDGLTSPPGPGRIARYDPKTGKHETFTPPRPGFGPRGVDVDTGGNVWVALGGSGHLARFDRRKCSRTWGTGAQCPEGWRLWPTPGPHMQGVADGGSADFHYYVWVDQFDTLGMGKDTVILNGTGSDSLLAFDPKLEKFTVIRIPYPLNSYTRGLDGRIDDPKSGWKGRGLWFDNGLDPLIHSEIPQSYVGWVQFRPDPLAR